MKRECIKTTYYKVGNKWEQSESEELGRTVCDLARWRNWQQMDQAMGGTARCVTIAANDSTMYEYITISPDKKHKVSYRFHGPVFIEGR